MGALTGLALGGCATARPPASSAAETQAIIEKLRAENAAYVRKVEELENQVFILNDELGARRSGDPPLSPAAAATPVLPQVKLAPGERIPEPEGPSAPESLVDETVVEYSGAAAERRGKRPLLRLWGADEGEPPASGEAEPPPAPRDRRRTASTASSASLPAAERDAGAGLRSAQGTAAYRRALELVQARRHDEAVPALRAFVKEFADHDFADNAQYWLGECFYDRKEYSAALREFRRVPEKFPHGNKVPDALLKTAFSYLALGSVRPARETLLEITRNHPRHPTADLAAAKLAEIDGKTTAAVAPLPKEKVR